MYSKIESKSYKNGYNGVSSYGNEKVVFTENYSGVELGIDPETGLKNYLNNSVVEITNTCFNGTYQATYTNTSDFNEQKQKELVVYYFNPKNKSSLKVIYSKDWTNVSFCHL